MTPLVHVKILRLSHFWISDTVIMVGGHIAVGLNLLFETAWLKCIQCYDKCQTLSGKFSPNQYLKSLIIPSSYHIILFSTFSFVEVTVFNICKWLFTCQVRGNLFSSVRNCYSVLPLVGDEAMCGCWHWNSRGCWETSTSAFPGTPASSLERWNVRFFPLLEVAKEVQILMFFKKGVATHSVSLIVALCI